MHWVNDPNSLKMYWMNGMAGTGKTTIAFTFCELLQEKSLLGANFFCSRAVAECSDIRRIVPTIAFQLARSSPQFGMAIVDAMKADFRLRSSPQEQLKQLIQEPFRCISDPIRDTLVIIIDALDECSNNAAEIRSFLEMIRDGFAHHDLPLKVLITSRPEPVLSIGLHHLHGIRFIFTTSKNRLSKPILSSTCWMN